MRTLKEELQLHKGEMVRIGSAVAFFYIGTVDDDTFSEIDQINDEYIKMFERQSHDYRVRIDGAEDIIRRKITKADEILIHGYTIDCHDGHHTKLNPKIRKFYQNLADMNDVDIREEARKERARLARAANKIDRYLEGSKRMLHRNVIDAYTADPIVDGPATIIIIEGNETGKYWLSSEYARLKKRGERDEDN